MRLAKSTCVHRKHNQNKRICTSPLSRLYGAPPKPFLAVYSIYLPEKINNRFILADM